MANLYEQFATDKDRETKGIVLDFGEYGEITIARAGGANKRFALAMKRLASPYKRQIEHDLMSTEAADALLREVFAESVVLGWKGIKDRENKDIKFSKKACIELFTDLPELFETVQDESKRVANFRVGELEDDAKN